MVNGYKNQPISGFTGYIPGAKWQVGSRYIPQLREPQNNPQRADGEASSQRSSSAVHSADNSHENYSVTNHSIPDDNSRNYSEMSNDELREKLSRLQMDMQSLQSALSTGNERSLEVPSNYNAARGDEAPGRMNRRSEYENRSSQDNASKQRSKSVPRRVENNPFDGIESGWWSKGEVLRNKERREIANGGQSVSGGNWNQRPPSRQRNSKNSRPDEVRDESQDIPTAGYSGHIQGLRHLGVGKSFNIAAKQAKKEYIERRRTYSGSRDTLNSRPRGVQYSDEEVLSNTVKLPDNRF